jgi:hypothetical protein
MEQGEELRLRYRVLVHGDDPAPKEIDRHFAEWTVADE